MTKKCDVLIIGTGVAGALIGRELSQQGLDVIMVDGGEGVVDRQELVEAYVTAPNKTMGSPYRGREGDNLSPSPDSADDYYDHEQSPNKFKATYQRRVGGSTWHWRGNSPRLIPSDFKLHSLYGVGVDWPISYDDLERWYCKAEHELGVAGDDLSWEDYLGAYRTEAFPLPGIPQSYGDKVISKRLEGFEYDGIDIKVLPTPQARNSENYQGRRQCLGSSSCDPICPIGAKYDATVHLALASRDGAQVISKAVATKLSIDINRMISTVSIRYWDQTEEEYIAKVVIVAAHAIETAKLLLMSASDMAPNGIANTSGCVGRYLMDHLQGQAAALIPEPVYPFRGPPTTSGIDEFRDGPHRKNNGAFRISVGNDGWGRVRGPYATLQKYVEEGYYGKKLKEKVGDILSRQFRMSYSTEMLPNENNRVTLSSRIDGLGIPRPKIHFDIDDYSYKAFEMASHVIDAIFTHIGATDKVFHDDSTYYSSANHIMGTCRMGDDIHSSVTDSYGKSHDHKNLYIVGSSLFPTCGTANPTLTIAAIALRAADKIASDFQNI